AAGREGPGRLCGRLMGWQGRQEIDRGRDKAVRTSRKETGADDRVGDRPDQGASIARRGHWLTLFAVDRAGARGRARRRSPRVLRLLHGIGTTAPRPSTFSGRKSSLERSSSQGRRRRSRRGGGEAARGTPLSPRGSWRPLSHVW